MKPLQPLFIVFLLLVAHKGSTQITYTKAANAEFGSVIEFSHSGETLLCGAANKISQRIASTGQVSKTVLVEGLKDVNDFAFLGNDTIYISNNGDDILIYDLRNAVVAGRLKGHTKKVTSLEIDAEARQLFSSSADKSTILWSLHNKSIIKQFKDHKGDVLATAIDKSTGRIASCGADGIVNLYDRNGNRLFSQKISDNWLWSLAFDPDGKHLAVGGEEMVYLLSDLDSPSPKINMLTDIEGKGYSLRFSPDGKYLALGTTQQYIYLFDWAVGRKQVERKIGRGAVTDLEFDPDGKSMVTTHSDMKGLLKWDLRSLNILPSKYVKNTSDKTPPQIYVSNPARITEDRVTVYTELLKLQGTVIDESGVFKVMVNGVQAPVSDNGTFTLNLPLSYSENLVTIEAHDVNNNVSIRRFTITRKDVAGSAYDPAKARNYLLVIGINNYKNWRPLYNAVNDANALAGTLSGLYNFNFSDITLLLDSQATRNHIYNTLRSYAEKVGPNDNFMIYFSGHGYFDKILNEGYWVPVDAQKNSVGDFLSNSDVLKIIRSINSQHTLVVADACFSGSLFNESSRGYVENVEKFRSRWGLASGRLEVVSDGEIGKNSPFAQALLEFLRTTNNEKMAISEVVQYVKTKVPDDAEQTPIGNPLKNAGDEGGEFVFYKRK